MLDNLLNILREGKNKVIYKINDDTITYEECYERVLELANNLKKQGISSVVVYGHKSIDQFVSVLACIVARRCYIPIDLCTPVVRIKEIIRKTGSTLVIKNEELKINEVECLSVEEINDIYQSKSREFKQNNDKAYIIFTSGSMGNSKGVPIGYDNLNHFISWITQLKEFDNCLNLNILSQASYSFDLSVMDIYFSIYKMGKIIAVDEDTKENLIKLYNTIQKEKINFLIMTPTFVKILLLDSYFNEMNFPSIKYMFFCGECLETITVRKIRNRFSKVKVINAYGPTEATCCVSLLEIKDEMLDEEFLPVGLINTSAVKIEIVNDEIILKGSSVFNNYLEFNSINCFKEEKINCYKTGDLGYINGDYLYCKGRMDNQIKYQGYRIELGDIENNLLKINGVREAVAIAKYKDKSNIIRLVKAFVVTEDNLDENDIKNELSTLVPSYMIPKKIVILDRLPYNKNGKYDRKKLSEL
jgi:D-alanine--poly(phosphoribitol) ligase subunit 1